MADFRVCSTDLFAAAWADPDSGVRKAAARALGRELPRQAARDALEAAKRQGDSEMRRVVGRVLSQHAAKERRADERRDAGVSTAISEIGDACSELRNCIALESRSEGDYSSVHLTQERMRSEARLSRLGKQWQDRLGDAGVRKVLDSLPEDRRRVLPHSQFWKEFLDPVTHRANERELLIRATVREELDKARRAPR